MATKCYIDYKGATTVKVPYNEARLSEIENQIKLEMKAEGKNFDDLDAVTDKVNELITRSQKKQTQRMLKQMDTFNKMTLIDNFAKDLQKQGLDNRTILNRLIGKIYDNYDTLGETPFEHLLNYNKSIPLAEFLQRAQKHIGNDIDIMDYLKTKKNLAQVMTEYNQFFKNPNATQAITKNTQAFNVARELFDAQFKMNEVKKLTGKNVLLNDLRLKPKWSIHKIKKTNKQQFIDEISNALDPDVHGDIARRNTLAEDLYNNMIDEGNWRDQGDLTPQNLDKDVWIPGEDRSPTYAFSDGDAFTNIISKYSDTDLGSALLLQFNEMAREQSLVQFLGADVANGIEQFDRIMKSYNNGRHTQISEDAITYLRQEADPTIIESSKLASVGRMARNVQASSKLGAAVITAIMDISNILFSGKHLFGMSTPKLLASIFRYGYKGAPEEYSKYAEAMLMGCDTYLNNIGDRFGHIGQGVAGASEEVTSKLANWTFKASGLNFWTEGRRAMVLGMYGKELGNLISTKTDFNTISKPFRAQLDKYGVSEKDWKALLRNQPLDADGRIDIHRIDQLDWETSYGKTSLKQKIVAAMRDVQDTMVMTPGAYDIAAGRLFQKPGSWGSEVIKTMFQFKSHPISFTRKTVMRTWKNSGSKTEAFAKMTLLGAEMMLLGVAVVQLKDIVKGKNPRNIDDANLWIRAAEQSGAYGLFSDSLLQLFGGSQMMSQFTDEPESSWLAQRDAMNQIIGPFLSEVMRTKENVASLSQRFAKDDWDGYFTNTTNELLTYLPFQNIWFAQMFRRMLFNDYLKERTDPKSYRRQQKRLEKVAKNNRVGGTDKNIIYRSIREALD
tara:strand:+ start:951 stop:3473 length:2523 start_codon:yes stop_codon:yes gene_type:complete